MDLNEEQEFAKRLVCALKINNVARIPISTEKFNNGISKLEKYLKKEKVQNVPQTIFVQNQHSGDYNRFSVVLQRCQNNGLRYSLEAPFYEEIVININILLAHRMLNMYEKTIPKEIMLKSAEKFCEGAGIQ